MATIRPKHGAMLALALLAGAHAEVITVTKDNVDDVLDNMIVKARATARSVCARTTTLTYDHERLLCAHSTVLRSVVWTLQKASPAVGAARRGEPERRQGWPCRLHEGEAPRRKVCGSGLSSAPLLSGQGRQQEDLPVQRPAQRGVDARVRRHGLEGSRGMCVPRAAQCCAALLPSVVLASHRHDAYASHHPSRVYELRAQTTRPRSHRHRRARASSRASPPW